MTNEQLCIQKMIERENLEAAIDAAREQLEQTNAPHSRVHKPTFGLCIAYNTCADDHFTFTGEFEALLPFVRILGSLDDQIALLKGSTE